MDKLSMDDEYRKLRASALGNQPTHVGSGLVRGLQGFGISVLGAVAGIVDQPIQELIHNENASASSVLAGFGRGVLGMFAKPVAGAMDLVLNTTEGLQGSAGLKMKMQRRRVPVQDNGKVGTLDTTDFRARLRHAKLKILLQPNISSLEILGTCRGWKRQGESFPAAMFVSSAHLAVVSLETETLEYLMDLRFLACGGDAGTYAANSILVASTPTSTDRENTITLTFTSPQDLTAFRTAIMSF